MSSDSETWIPSKAQQGATSLSIFYLLSVSQLSHLLFSKACLSHPTCSNLTFSSSLCRARLSLLVPCQLPVYSFPRGNTGWQMQYPPDGISAVLLAPRSLPAPQHVHRFSEPRSFPRTGHLFSTAVVSVSRSSQLGLPSPSRISLYAGLLQLASPAATSLTFCVSANSHGNINEYSSCNAASISTYCTYFVYTLLSFLIVKNTVTDIHIHNSWYSFPYPTYLH